MLWIAVCFLNDDSAPLTNRYSTTNATHHRVLRESALHYYEWKSSSNGASRPPRSFANDLDVVINVDVHARGQHLNVASPSFIRRSSDRPSQSHQWFVATSDKLFRRVRQQQAAAIREWTRIAGKRQRQQCERAPTAVGTKRKGRGHVVDSVGVEKTSNRAKRAEWEVFGEFVANSDNHVAADAVFKAAVAVNTDGVDVEIISCGPAAAF